tara:strand:+ start:475 stop:723 length:249 start_codon:yes stop_codon:yes gene_type:complete
MRSFEAPSSTQAQLFLGVEALQLLMIHDCSFAFLQHAYPAAAKPTPLAANLLHFFANFWTIQRVITPYGLEVDTDKPARPTL